MNFGLADSPAQLTAAAKELAESNRISQKFGLTLSPAEASMLVQSRAEALRETGRIEFGGGTLKKLALAFCDSPFIQQSDWANTLARLQTIFYELKNETGDRLGDDALISRMVARFNGGAGGSLDALESTPPKQLLYPEAERGREAVDEH